MIIIIYERKSQKEMNCGILWWNEMKKKMYRTFFFVISRFCVCVCVKEKEKEKKKLCTRILSWKNMKMSMTCTRTNIPYTHTHKHTPTNHHMNPETDSNSNQPPPLLQQMKTNEMANIIMWNDPNIVKRECKKRKCKNKKKRLMNSIL